VGYRFDDWIYWMPLLQLHLIITAHTLKSFLIMNLSLYFFWISGLSLFPSLLLLSTTHCSVWKISLITSGEPYRNHRPQGFQYCICLHCAGYNVLIRGNTLIPMFVAARRVLTICCLATVCSALPREHDQ
jgi:hypothetical protein